MDLRQTLMRQFQSDLFWRIYGLPLHSTESKLSYLAIRLTLPGPPLHKALSWVSPSSHRSAIAAFFTGDLFLGRYAGNFFAKSLLPKSATRRATMRANGLDPSRICLFCWMRNDMTILEDETHMWLECPRYQRHRDQLWNNISPGLREQICEMQSSETKLQAYLAAVVPGDWAAI
eukprot:7354398-Karenia_brevis.AAC.1